LVLYASPGALTPPEAAAWMAENFNNTQTRFVGYGVHYIQEDQPEAIGRNLSDWLRDEVN
jgi:haloalkane dehalogenase